MVKRRMHNGKSNKLEARLSDIEDILEMLSKEPEKPKKKVKEKKVGKRNSKDK